MSKIKPDDYLVNMHAIYVLDTLGIRDLTYFDDPEQNRSIYREEVEINADTYEIQYKRAFGYEALATHTLKTKETDFLLRELTEAFAEVAELPAPELDEEAPTVHLRLTYKSGAVVTYLCNFDRRSLPKNWTRFVSDVRVKFDFYNTRGDLLSDKLIQHGRRDDEYIYCTVYDNTTRNRGYYLTDDDTIRAGDRVSVPTEEGPITGKVSKVEYFTAENVPTPPETLQKIAKKINP